MLYGFKKYDAGDKIDELTSGELLAINDEVWDLVSEDRGVKNNEVWDFLYGDLGVKKDDPGDKIDEIRSGELLAINGELLAINDEVGDLGSGDRGVKNDEVESSSGDIGVKNDNVGDIICSNVGVKIVSIIPIAWGYNVLGGIPCGPTILFPIYLTGIKKKLSWLLLK